MPTCPSASDFGTLHARAWKMVGKAGSTTREVLANIDAIQLAIGEALGATRFEHREPEAIQARLARSSTSY